MIIVIITFLFFSIKVLMIIWGIHIGPLYLSHTYLLSALWHPLLFLFWCIIMYRDYRLLVVESLPLSCRILFSGESPFPYLVLLHLPEILATPHHYSGEHNSCLEMFPTKLFTFTPPPIIHHQPSPLPHHEMAFILINFHFKGKNANVKNSFNVRSENERDAGSCFSFADLAYRLCIYV